MMTQTIETGTCSEFTGKGRGWTFSQRTDFNDSAIAFAIDSSIQRLTRGEDRRFCRGFYLYRIQQVASDKKLAPKFAAVAERFRAPIRLEHSSPRGFAAI